MITLLLSAQDNGELESHVTMQFWGYKKICSVFPDSVFVENCFKMNYAKCKNKMEISVTLGKKSNGLRFSLVECNSKLEDLEYCGEVSLAKFYPLNKVITSFPVKCATDY